MGLGQCVERCGGQRVCPSPVSDGECVPQEVPLCVFAAVSGQQGFQPRALWLGCSLFPTELPTPVGQPARSSHSWERSSVRTVVWFMPGELSVQLWSHRRGGQWLQRSVPC